MGGHWSIQHKLNHVIAPVRLNDGVAGIGIGIGPFRPIKACLHRHNVKQGNVLLPLVQILDGVIRKVIHQLIMKALDFTLYGEKTKA